MLKKEFLRTRLDGINLYKSYSDEGYLIRQIETDTLYDEAIDIEDAPYTYEETDTPIEDEEITDEEALKIIMGGMNDE